MDLIIALSICVGLIVGLIVYAFLMPRRTQTFSPDNDEVTRNNIILRMATVVGSEIYSSLPAQNRPIPRDSLEKTRMLLVKSGNPWQLKPQEFLFMRWVCALFGLMFGGLVSLAVATSDIVNIPWSIIVIGFGALGFFSPAIIHNDKAKERDLVFKKQLPEALDLIIISTSSQKILSDAIRESVENMTPGILRNEFVNIIRSVDAGRSMHEALDDFADRAPNEGVITFVASLQEALEMNVDISELMKSRAESSRQELYALVRTRAAALPSSIAIVLFPTMLIAFILTILAPIGYELLSTFSSI